MTPELQRFIVETLGAALADSWRRDHAGRSQARRLHEWRLPEGWHSGFFIDVTSEDGLDEFFFDAESPFHIAHSVKGSFEPALRHWAGWLKFQAQKS